MTGGGADRLRVGPFRGHIPEYVHEERRRACTRHTITGRPVGLSSVRPSTWRSHGQKCALSVRQQRELVASQRRAGKPNMTTFVCNAARDSAPCRADSSWLMRKAVCGACSGAGVERCDYPLCMEAVVTRTMAAVSPNASHLTQWAVTVRIQRRLPDARRREDRRRCRRSSRQTPVRLTWHRCGSQKSGCPRGLGPSQPPGDLRNRETLRIAVVASKRHSPAPVMHTITCGHRWRRYCSQPTATERAG